MGWCGAEDEVGGGGALIEPELVEEPLAGAAAFGKPAVVLEGPLAFDEGFAAVGIGSECPVDDVKGAEHGEEPIFTVELAGSRPELVGLIGEKQIEAGALANEGGETCFFVGQPGDVTGEFVVRGEGVGVGVEA